MKLNSKIYCLYGTDSYLLKQKTESIIKQEKLDVADVFTFDLEEDSFEDCYNQCVQIPLFSDRIGVVISSANFLSSQKSAKDAKDELLFLERYLDHPIESTVLILQVTQERLDTKKSIYKKLEQLATIIACVPEENEDNYGKVKAILKEHGMTIDANALQTFLSRTAHDRYIMKNELDKLLLFAQGKDRVTMEMVREVVSRNLEENIFTLVNAILAKDTPMMISVYRDLLKSNVEIGWMIGVLMNKFQEILLTKELLREKKTFEDVMKYFAASKGRVYYMMKNAKEIDDNSLFQTIVRLEKLDYEIKSGLVDKNLGFEVFMLKSMES